MTLNSKTRIFFFDVMGSNQNFIEKKLGLSWAKLKFSLVRVVDEVTIIFNSVEVEIVKTPTQPQLNLTFPWFGFYVKMTVDHHHHPPPTTNSMPAISQLLLARF